MYPVLKWVTIMSGSGNFNFTHVHVEQRMNERKCYLINYSMLSMELLQVFWLTGIDIKLKKQ